MNTQLEVVDEAGTRVGLLVANDDGTIQSLPPELETVLLGAKRAGGQSDADILRELSRGWSNGYWSVRPRA